MSPTETTILNAVGTILLTAYLVVGLFTCRRLPRDERISKERMAYLRAEACKRSGR